MNQFVKLFAKIGSIAVASYAVGSIYDRYIASPAIVFTMSSDLEKTTVYPGGTLELALHVRNTTRKGCSGLVDREFHRVENRADGPTEVVVTIVNTTTAFLDPPPDRFLLQLAVPPNIEPGEWFYRSRTTYSCSGLTSLFGLRQLWSPEVPVTIKPVPVAQKAANH